MQSLREAGVAHGDLQHGNIIVERGQLRVVDLDGMFVPAMSGWRASEMGHQHFQHPLRDASLFNASLDDFSALVVYLSLVSLAERPELWAEHHDENLLFTRADFLSPEASALFAKIKEIGPEHRKLAEALQTAARALPPSAPNLFDLVSRRSHLPSWMVAPPNIEITGRTREATPAEMAALGTATAQWTPWQAGRASRPLPSSPASNTVQSVFSGPVPAQGAPPAALYTPPDPSDIGVNALRHSKELVKKVARLWWVMILFLRWLPAIFLDIAEFPAFVLMMLFVAASILIYGLARAIIESRAAHRLNSAPARQTALPAGAHAPSPLPFWLWNAPTTSTLVVPAPAPPAQRAVPAQPPATTLKDPLVGSRTLGIYHTPTCEWALKISSQNCVGFRSARAAQSAGYHPCQICAP
jgi:hypothetical protein